VKFVWNASNFSALSTCLLLNLRGLSPVFDPVQLEVAEKEMAHVGAIGFLRIPFRVQCAQLCLYIQRAGKIILLV
jgi:hypothetical protein